MRRASIIFLIVAGVLFAGGGTAVADTFTWSQPVDFTSTGSGSNPEQKYGEPSWSYASSVGPMTFSSGQWSDGSGGTIGPNGSNLAMRATPANSVTLGWTSPFSVPISVSVSGNISDAGTPLALCGFSWSLENAGSSVASGGDSGDSINNTATVAPGASLTLTVTNTSNVPMTSCDTALVTLTLQATGSSTVTLDSPAREPLLTSTPTLTGSAAIAPGDGNLVAVAIFPGSSASGTPAATDTGSVGSDGHYSVTVAPGLADGEYTAAAVQHAPSGNLVSAPVTFRIKANAPAVTLDQPTSGSRVGESSPMFSGQAGSTSDDSVNVTMLLYQGGSTQGTSLGTMTVTRSGGTWAGTWPNRLSPGLYTAQAQQTDDAGHTGISQPVTFHVVVPPKVVGAAVKLSSAGIVSVTVACAGTPGQICSGDVSILTARSFRPSRGSPRGPLQLMFSYVNIPDNQKTVVRGGVPPGVRRTLRGSHTIKVRVTATLAPGGQSPITVSVIRTLHL